MKREDTRLRQLLDAMPRNVLYALARVVSAEATPKAYKDELIDILVAFPLAVLRRGFAEGVALPDLRRLCTRFGYSSIGSQARLATRLIEALDDPGLRISRWRPFEQARTFARRLQLGSMSEWFSYTQGKLPAKAPLPDDIPVAPNQAYANKGWNGAGDFLGTDNPAKHLIRYRSFPRARAYARALGLANASEWRSLCGRKTGNRRVIPPDIPSAPEQVYASNGWLGYGDWLGTGRLHASKIEYRTYRRARAFVRSLGIRSETEWRAYCRGEINTATPRPVDVPSNPNRTYKGTGWVSWGHFFGTNSIANYNRSFRSFDAARTFVRKQGITDSTQWRIWSASGNRPPDIPSTPDVVYRSRGWVSWRHFFRND